jgi:HrpA-like RNA helicase
MTTRYVPETPPWNRYADRKLFGRDGEAAFKRFSAEYDDFKAFFQRYNAFAAKNMKLMTAEDELEHARKGMELFRKYQDKRNEKLKAKITETRISLPIKPFERAIVDSVRKNKVTLIAADTGAGT